MTNRQALITIIKLRTTLRKTENNEDWKKMQDEALGKAEESLKRVIRIDKAKERMDTELNDYNSGR